MIWSMVRSFSFFKWTEKIHRISHCGKYSTNEVPNWEADLF